MKVKYKCKLKYDLEGVTGYRYVDFIIKYQSGINPLYKRLDSPFLYFSDSPFKRREDEDDESFEECVDLLHKKLSTEEGRLDLINKAIEAIKNEIKTKHNLNEEQNEVCNKLKEAQEHINSLSKGEFEI